MWKANPKRILFEVLSQLSAVRLSSLEKKELGESVENLVRHKRLLEHCSTVRQVKSSASTGNLPSEYCAWQKRLGAMELLPWTANCNALELPEAVRFSFPDSLHRKLFRQLGSEKCRHFCEVSNEIPNWSFLRVNSMNKWADATQTVSRHLVDLGFQVSQCDRIDNCLKVTGSGKAPLQQLPLYLKGHVEIQDESSQLVSKLVQCEPSHTVIDLCSGAGGKSLAIAARLGPTGHLVLHEPRPQALRRAKWRLDRAALQNGPCFHFASSGGVAAWTGKADWVLVDAPCSNTATLRHHPECKYRCFEQEDDVCEMSNLLDTQRQVLRQAAFLLKDGGMLVYSTCSALTEENDWQVLWATSTESQLGLTMVLTQSCLPEKGGSDGYFAAVLRKLGTNA